MSDDPISVLYVSADEEVCARARDELESAAGKFGLGGEFRVASVSSIDALSEALAEATVDCVVFREDDDPLAAGGVQLLDVADLCTAPPGAVQDGSVPVILFSDGTFPMPSAKGTDGVVDYVRADGEDPYANLANRIRWITTSDEVDGGWHKRLVEGMAEGVLTFDADAEIRATNEAAGDHFGFPLDEFGGLTPGDVADRGLISGADADALADAVLAAGASEVRELEFRVTPVFADDDRRVLAARVTGLPGAPEGALVTLRDVTDYKRLEHELDAVGTRIERLSTALDRIRDVEDRQELFEVAVEAASGIFDADLYGFDGVEDGTFVPRTTVGGEYDRSSATGGEDARALQTGEPLLVDEIGPEDVPIEGPSSVVYVPIGDAGVLRILSGGTLTERDRDLAATLGGQVAERLDHLDTRRSRETARERLSSLQDTLPHPVATYAFEDQQPVIRSVNPAFEETFGVQAASVVGDPLREHVSPPSEDPRAAVEGDDGTNLDDLDAALRVDRHTTAQVRRATTEGVRDFDLHASPAAVDDEDGQAVYVDVTDQRRAERAVDRQTERLGRISEVLTDDLRDRLNEARGYLELAAETGDPEDMGEVKQAHDGIGRLLEDLRGLIDQDPDLELASTSIEKAATRAWASVETGNADFSVEDTTVVADEDRLKGLLEQLFRNAVDHAGDALQAGIDESSSLSVAVGPLTDREGFFVADTQTSVPESLQGRTLEPGSSDAVEEAEPRLAAVQQVADDHGWAMRIEPHSGGGTRFEFRADADE